MVYKENTFSLLIFLVVVALALGQDTNPSAGIDYKVQNENAQKVYIQPTPPSVPTTTQAPITTSTTPQPTTTQSTTPQPTPPPTKPSTTTTSTTTTTTTTQKPTTTPGTTTTSTTTTTTTPPPPTTTVKPTTPPPATKDDWYIKGDDGNICILAHMQFVINVQYPAKNKTLLHKEFTFSKIADANATGSCSTINDQQKLELTFTNNITAELVFAENKTDKVYSWKSLHLNIPTTDLDESNFTAPVALTSNAELFTVPLNNSYTCASWKELHMNSSVANTTATVKITNARLEAFGTIKNQSYSAGIDCSPQTPDIVPIVVGLILAGLVVVVLVAYLIGRRRAQARGYLSM